MCTFQRSAGRPQGQVRQALMQAAEQLALQQGGATWRCMAVQSQVGWAAAKRTARDMQRAGQLLPVGEMRTPHAKRPMVLLAPAGMVAGSGAGAQRLATALQGWVGGPNRR